MSQNSLLLLLATASRERGVGFGRQLCGSSPDAVKAAAGCQALLQPLHAVPHWLVHCVDGGSSSFVSSEAWARRGPLLGGGQLLLLVTCAVEVASRDGGRGAGGGGGGFQLGFTASSSSPVSYLPFHVQLSFPTAGPAGPPRLRIYHQMQRQPPATSVFICSWVPWGSVLLRNPFMALLSRLNLIHSHTWGRVPPLRLRPGSLLPLWGCSSLSLRTSTRPAVGVHSTFPKRLVLTVHLKSPSVFSKPPSNPWTCFLSSLLFLSQNMTQLLVTHLFLFTEMTCTLCCVSSYLEWKHHEGLCFVSMAQSKPFINICWINEFLCIIFIPLRNYGGHKNMTFTLKTKSR